MSDPSGPPQEEEAPADLARTVKRGAVVSGAGYGLSQLISFVSTLALARLLTPGEYGTVAAGTILLSVGIYFAESGMLGALIQRRDRIEEAANTAFVSTFLTGAGLSLLALAAAPLVGLFFHSHEVTLVAAASSALLFVRASMIVPDALMQRRFNFVRRVTVDPGMALAYTGTAVGLAAAGFGIWSLVIGQYASLAAGAATAWGLARWRPRPRMASFAMWRQLARFGRHGMVGSLGVQARDLLESAVVGRALSVSALGSYRYARRLTAMPAVAMVSVGSYVLLPAFARIGHDEERLRGSYLRALRWYAIVALPISFVLLALGKPLAVVLLGERWADAGTALMAMFAFTASEAVVSISAEAARAADKPHLLSQVAATTLVAAVAALFALLPFGLVGVAAAVSVASVVIGAVTVVLSARLLRIAQRRLLAELWPPAVAGAALVAVGYPLEWVVLHAQDHPGLGGVPRLVLELVACLVTYLGVLSACDPSVARAVVGAGPRLRSRLARRHPVPPAA